MKFAICNEMYEQWPIEKVFAHAARTGYQGVEVAPFTLADDCREISAARRKEIREAANREGVQVIGLHWLLLKPAGLHINAPDATLRKKTEEYVEALIDLCADLGGEIMVWGSPKQRQVLAPFNWSDAYKHLVDALQRLGAKAHAKKVTICFEPLGPKDNCNLINTMGEGTRLVEDVKSPGVKLHLDVKAMNTEGRPIAETLRMEGGKHLWHFHANDPNLRGPGMGEMAYEPIMQALKAVNYDRWISVEVFDFTPGAEATAEISLKTLKRAMANA